jgi:hypothetical protein
MRTPEFRARRRTPEYRAKHNVQQRAWRQAHPDYMNNWARANYAKDPVAANLKGQIIKNNRLNRQDQGVLDGNTEAQATR